jgi:hypothetical protein
MNQRIRVLLGQTRIGDLTDYGDVVFWAVLIGFVVVLLATALVAGLIWWNRRMRYEAERRAHLREHPSDAPPQPETTDKNGKQEPPRIDW